jgi:hypothetical protein
VGPTAAKMAIDFLASIHDLQSGAAAIDPSAIDNVISNIVNGSTSGFSAELVGVQSADAPTALHG